MQTPLVQHLRQQAVLEGDICVGAGIAGRAFGDTGHAIEMMVAPGQDTGAGGEHSAVVCMLF